MNNRVQFYKIIDNISSLNRLSDILSYNSLLGGYTFKYGHFFLATISHR